MNFETLKERYENNRITLVILKVYVRKGVISSEEYEEITGEMYK